MGRVFVRVFPNVRRITPSREFESLQSRRLVRLAGSVMTLHLSSHTPPIDWLAQATFCCTQTYDEPIGSLEGVAPRARIVALRPSHGKAPSASKTAGTRHQAIMYTM